MSDSKASPPNIPPAAFTGTFKQIGEMATSATSHLPENEREITLVYLGDVFDLIRTSAWLEIENEEERPWGSGYKPEHALRIARDILDCEGNRECFDVMGGDLTRYGFPRGVKRVFLPGNHDRLVNLDINFIRFTEKVLGLIDPATGKRYDGRASGERFPHWFAEAKHHKVFARHGQEWDGQNFGGSKAFGNNKWQEVPEADYDATPIGDLVAAELISSLPGVVSKKLADMGAGASVISETDTRLRDLFDLRPAGAIPAYLAWHISQCDDPDVQDAIAEAVRERAEAFRDIEFVRRWLSQHENLLGFGIRVVTDLLKGLEMTWVDRIAPAADLLANLVIGDNHAKNAADDFDRIHSAEAPEEFGGAEFRYVLYGHTHKPDQHPVSANPDRIYVNTGMWRPAIHSGVRDGFVLLNHLTFTMIYRPDEVVSKGEKKDFPAIESWSGCLKER